MATIERVKPVQLPIGEAQRINQFTSDNWKEYFIRLGQVKNTVLWVNPDVYIPFRLEVGKPSPLGLFVENVLKEKPDNSQEGKIIAEVWPYHNKSVILGRAIIGDNEGRVYRDIDMKGIGHVDRYGSRCVIGQLGYSGGGNNRYGLLDREVAEYDREMTDKFLKLGIRTNRTLAIIGLEEVISGGKIISARELKKIYDIPDKFEPVLTLRAFRTRSRIKDLLKSDLEEALITDAKKLVSEEIGLGRVMSDEEYWMWFAKTIGRNVGLLHAEKLSHGYLTEHNITLDGSVVDLDSVGECSEKNLYDDLSTLRDSLMHFVDYVIQASFDGTELRSQLSEWCKNAYNEVVPRKDQSIGQREALSIW